MPIADCRLPIEKQIGLRPYKARSRAPKAFPCPFFNQHSAIGNRQSAFTLIELLVAVGLMAILLTMIATIFSRATQAFRQARAAIEIHESARAAFNALVDDLSAAEFTSYDTGVRGYFALSQGPTDFNTGAYSAPPASPGAPGSPAPLDANGVVIPEVDTLTFTTLAPQPGARYAAPETVDQLALVRYALEWDGGSATVSGTKVARPTYNLVKRVRFPCTNDPNLDMDIFDWSLKNTLTGQTYLTTEFALPSTWPPTTTPTDPDVVLDLAGLRYAQSEVIAFHVLAMNVRLFCLPAKQTSEPLEIFLDTGIASAGSTSTTLVDNGITGYYAAKNWTSNFPGAPNLRIFAGTGAGQPALPPPALQLPVSASGNTLTVTNTMNPAPASGSQYRVEDTLAGVSGGVTSTPGWYQRGTYNFFGTTYRPPAMVEVTLELTDSKATRSFLFTQRIYVVASER